MCIGEGLVLADSHRTPQPTKSAQSGRKTNLTPIADLAKRFAPLAKSLQQDEQKIVDELNGVQGSKVDVGGYYLPVPEKAAAVMRPSSTLNSHIDTFSKA